MENKIIVLDGNNCKDEMSFYYEFYKNFTDIGALIRQGYLNKEGKFNGCGFNPAACDDILCGDFVGVIDVDDNDEPEKITVIFKNFEHAKKNLSFKYSKGKKFIDVILEIFDGHSYHVDFRLE